MGLDIASRLCESEGEWCCVTDSLSVLAVLLPKICLISAKNSFVSTELLQIKMVGYA